MGSAEGGGQSRQAQGLLRGGSDRVRRPLGRITDDPRHSEDEERYVLLGLSERQRLLAVMFTERGEAIRLISARKATRRERRDYETSKS